MIRLKWTVLFWLLYQLYRSGGIQGSLVAFLEGYLWSYWSISSWQDSHSSSCTKWLWHTLKGVDRIQWVSRKRNTPIFSHWILRNLFLNKVCRQLFIFTLDLIRHVSHFLYLRVILRKTLLMLRTLKEKPRSVFSCGEWQRRHFLLSHVLPSEVAFSG